MDEGRATPASATVPAARPPPSGPARPVPPVFSGTAFLRLLGVMNAEKEVIYIVAPSEQADLIFERAYVAGKLDTPGMGMIYVTPLEKMATYVPPAILERFLGD